MLQILIKGHKVTNLNNDCNVTNSEQRSQTYKIRTMTEMSKIQIKGKKVTKSEQCHKF
jgi:hypothetical protein